ncbi:hypothetical protein ACFQYP_54590 [Nonomuraea antimicrobica]
MAMASPVISPGRVLDHAIRSGSPSGRGEVDGRDAQPVAQPGPGGLQHLGDQRALARADVDQVERAGFAQLRVHLREQRQHRAGEGRRGADRGAEVARRAFAEVETLVAVQRALHCGAPGEPHARTIS